MSTPELAAAPWLATVRKALAAALAAGAAAAGAGLADGELGSPELYVAAGAALVAFAAVWRVPNAA